MVKAQSTFIGVAFGRYGNTRGRVTEQSCTGMANVINVYAWSLLRGNPTPEVVDVHGNSNDQQVSELLNFRMNCGRPAAGSG